MYQRPLVTENIEAGAQFIQAFHKLMPVKIAFWLKASGEDEPWELYIASESIDAAELGKGYRQVSRLIRDMRTIWLEPYRVKLISGDDPLALAFMDMQQQVPGSLPTRLSGGRFADLTVDDVFIYPLPVAETVA